MPLFFFDIKDRDGFHKDEYGIALSSFEEARVQAIALLPDIARQDLPDGERHEMVCDVRDETDRVVYTAELIFRGQRR